MQPKSLQKTWPFTLRTPIGSALLIVFLFSVPIGLTLDVGLPSSQKAALLFDNETHQQLIPVLKKLREKLYNQISGEGTLRIRAGFEESSAEEVVYHQLRCYLLQAMWSDETAPIRALQNINPKKLRFNPQFHQYGALFFYSVGAGIQFSSWFGIIPPPQDIERYLANPDATKRLWLIPRIQSFIALIGSALILYLLVTLLYGKNWGLLGCLLMISSPALMMETHYLKPYNQSLLFICLAQFLLQKVQQTKNVKYLYACAVASATSAAILPTNAIFSAPLLLVAWFWRHRFKDKNYVFLKAFLILAVSFLTMSPFWILEPLEVMKAFTNDPVASSGPVLSGSNWVRCWVQTFPRGFSLLIYLAALGGMILSIIERNIFVSAWIIPYILITPFITLSFNPHYTAPLYPSAVVFAIYALTFIKKKWPSLSLLLALGIGVTLVLQFIFYITILEKFHKRQFEVGEWINKNIPMHSTIGSTRITSVFPPFRLLNYKHTEFTDEISPSTREREKVSFFSLSPQYYLAANAEPLPSNPNFQSLYETEQTFPVRTPFDSIIKNHFYPILNTPITVYRLKQLEN
ncbi:MAG: hypothetical protein KCHDKBKB_00112 [Elusimicrobia bacterium]|nr:hypothetical protein [Elusimicrobiota bacterium]